MNSKVSPTNGISSPIHSVASLLDGVDALLIAQLAVCRSSIHVWIIFERTRAVFPCGPKIANYLTIFALTAERD